MKELGDFHQGIGSTSVHFCSVMNSVNPCKDLCPSYFLNSPFLTLINKAEREKFNFFVSDPALIQGSCLIEGGAYLSKYGNFDINMLVVKTIIMNVQYR